MKFENTDLAVRVGDALRISNFTERRKRLRRLIDPYLPYLERARIKRAFEESPLVGTGKGQIKPRPTPTGLRDSLSTDVLAGVLLRSAALLGVRREKKCVNSVLSDVLNAIEAPSMHGSKDGRGPKGYAFGRPLGEFFEPHRLSESLMKAKALSLAAERTPEPTFTTLHTTKGLTMNLDNIASGDLTVVIYLLKAADISDVKTLLLNIGEDTEDRKRIERVYDLVLGDGEYAENLSHYTEILNDNDGDVRKALKQMIGATHGKPSKGQRDALSLTEKALELSKTGAKALSTSGEGVSEGGAELSMTDEEAAPARASIELPDDDSKKGIINLALAQAGLPPIEEMVAQINTSSVAIIAAKEAAAQAQRDLLKAMRPSTGVGGTDYPDGEVEAVKAADIFGLKAGTKSYETFSFDVPRFKWDAPHPLVPEADENYIFRPFELLKVLHAVVANKRCYLHGHTGTGKTTLIEQVAARLNWPFVRVNFDSEITRMDLIGKDKLSEVSGATVSHWEDGVLPQSMASPVILCLDEFDFIRSDVSYVMQRALEGDGMMITEDGGRVVNPHPMFRVFATGNTTGQGDEYGMYPGARPQSMALLDRFTMWLKVPYLSAQERRKLIVKAAPALDAGWVDKINQYVTEHLEAFTGSRVLQPISPRGFMELASTAQAFMEYLPDQNKAMTEALDTVVLDRATTQDRAVLKGLVDRIFG